MPPTDGQADPIVLKLAEEIVTVGKRQRVRRRLRIATVTHERPHTLHETLAGNGVEVERVPIGEPVDAVPPVRVEGDVTILPVVEERIVVTRRLVLVEEIRVRTIRTTREWKETVTLRSQDITVDEITADEPSGSGHVAAAPPIRE